ncbi:uncharacterized protein EI97DRAFT_244479 [Westerdykella ornata]|uniref:Uncharacterized protein n=1 Tax=Westerdykella ornata TaxID=318751 RepID=A0A6A6J6I3_WESOR|nr:uncharacterized protein EI97DRAFT_244479 [Westerdykella ornata]KAF2271824.1 hypothetical protein EI97DRAFT_244479 [Westerdykella ornata]
MDNGQREGSHQEEDCLRSTANEREGSSRNTSHGGHKRSISGTLLESLSFLKSSAMSGTSSSARTDDQEHGVEEISGIRRGSSMTQAVRQTQGRKRKGSLRKTAILGTGKLLRERRLSLRAAPKPISVDTTTSPSSPQADGDTTPRRFTYEDTSLSSSSDSLWLPPARIPVPAGTAGPTGEGHLDSTTPRADGHRVVNPIGPYASTTDDDEGLTFFRPTVATTVSSSFSAVPGHSSSTPSLQRRRSNRANQLPSLAITHTPPEIAPDEEWDYSETEWWGWVVLVVTWLVFVVGMGSCLGVWSWAWDVGETPYAPPELEDDPTLPITGYYPALMVCTAVMAWVWVIVAWVGMKYFRHAKDG